MGTGKKPPQIRLKPQSPLIDKMHEMISVKFYRRVVIS